jgi:mono/diheme cytochrome c family protein
VRRTGTLVAALAVAAAAFAGCRPRGPAFTTPDGAIDARALFSATCAKCHGEDGHAHTPQGQLVGAKDLMRDEARALTDEAIRRQIALGKGRMPAFGGAITEAEVDALVREVRRRQQLARP